MLPSVIREKPLKEFYGIWRTRHGDDRRLPGRDGMDTLDLPKSVLPHAFIYEREADGRFRCRLAGTCLVEELGYEPTGKLLDDRLATARGRHRLALFVECATVPRALYYRARPGVIGREHRETGRLLLPVGDVNGAARFVFGEMMVARTAAAVMESTDNGGLIVVHRDLPLGGVGARDCG